MARSRKLLELMHEEDREEAIDLHERIGEAIGSGDSEALAKASRALTELLFFVEGHVGRPSELSKADGLVEANRCPVCQRSFSRRGRLFAMRRRSHAPDADCGRSMATARSGAKGDDWRGEFELALAACRQRTANPGHARRRGVAQARRVAISALEACFRRNAW